MFSTKENTTYSVVGFFGLLTILFIGLKLCNVIDWSWWLVLLPLYGPFVLLAIVLSAFLGVVFTVAIFTDFLKLK